ncbi:caspase, EACC1-associated type [Kitasatospora sp. P5_F3]
MSALPLLPDRASSWAVLIAVGAYAELSAMPEAVRSAELLADHLGGPDGVFEPDRVIRVFDPQSAREVTDRIAWAAGQATSTLFVYYAGHGVTGGGAERLHFALPGTVDQSGVLRRTALSADALFAAMGQRATHRVAVLDCCFAGLALDEPAAADLHLLTAVDRSRKALFNQELGLTRFAEELLRLFEEGVPDAGSCLDLDLIYRQLAVNLSQLPAKRSPAYVAPIPIQRTVDASGSLALARNRAYGTARTEPGLRARAAFAYRQFAVRHRRQPWHQPQATALLHAIATDAADSLGRTHPLTFQLRNAHAQAVGATEGHPAALALLEPLATEAAAALPADSPVLAVILATLAEYRT